MEYRVLGSTGVRVSALCLGAMMFGDWGNKDHEESINIIHRAIDGGINFIDTADVYSQGESEIIVGKALKGIERSNNKPYAKGKSYFEFHDFISRTMFCVWFVVASLQLIF